MAQACPVSSADVPLSRTGTVHTVRVLGAISTEAGSAVLLVNYS